MEELTNNPTFRLQLSEDDDLRSVLAMDEIDIKLEETEQEDKDVVRQDNDEEYNYKRKVYEVLTIIICCFFFFSTSYSKATAKDMQTIVPDRCKSVTPDEFLASLIYIELPVMFIAPFAGYLVNR
eukprot:274913_1